MKQRIKTVAEINLSNATPQSFEYFPIPAEKKLKAVLFSGGISFSLASKGGTEVIFSEQQQAVSTKISPDKKQLRLELELKGEVLKGTLRLLNTAENITARVYFIMEEDETGR